MYEVIDKIDGEEPPQLVIVDESVRDTKIVEEMIKRGKRNWNSKIREGIIPIYIGRDNFEKGMSDSEIIEIGINLGYPFILTHDKDFYRFKKDYEKNKKGYGRIIVLRQLDSIYNYLMIIKKAGIEISGNSFKKVKSFG